MTASLKSIEGEGGLSPLPNCSIQIPGGPGGGLYGFKSIPDISDSKKANYSSQDIFGRSSPIQSYSNSSARTISFDIDLYNLNDKTRGDNFNLIRAVAMAVHPAYDGTYAPPPICKFKCGPVLSGSSPSSEVNWINVLITDYNISYGKETVYDENLMPFHVSLKLSLEVVHTQQTLPGRDQVLQGNF